MFCGLYQGHHYSKNLPKTTGRKKNGTLEFVTIDAICYAVLNPIP